MSTRLPDFIEAALASPGSSNTSSTNPAQANPQMYNMSQLTNE